MNLLNSRLSKGQVKHRLRKKLQEEECAARVTEALGHQGSVWESQTLQFPVQLLLPGPESALCSILAAGHLSWLHSTASSDRRAAQLSCSCTLSPHPAIGAACSAEKYHRSAIISTSKHPAPINSRSFVCFHRQELEKWTWKVINVILPLQVSLKLRVTCTASDLLCSDGACPQPPSLTHTGVSPAFPQNNLAAQWPLKVPGWWQFSTLHAHTLSYRRFPVLQELERNPATSRREFARLNTSEHRRDCSCNPSGSSVSPSTFSSFQVVTQTEEKPEGALVKHFLSSQHVTAHTPPTAENQQC